MDEMAEADRIDIHEFRHGLKLLTETRHTAHYVNKKEFDCPACSRPFDAVFVSEKRHNSFRPDRSKPFCIRQEDDRILLFTH